MISQHFVLNERDVYFTRTVDLFVVTMNSYSSDLTSPVDRDCDSGMDLRDLHVLSAFSPTVTSTSPAVSLEGLNIGDNKSSNSGGSDSGATSPEMNLTASSSTFNGKRCDSFGGRLGSSCLSSPEPPGIIGQPRAASQASNYSIMASPAVRSPGMNGLTSSSSPHMASPAISSPMPPQTGSDVNTVVTEITSNLRRLADMIEKNGYPGVVTPAQSVTPSSSRVLFPSPSPGLDSLAPLINLDPIALRNLEMLARVADQSVHHTSNPIGHAGHSALNSSTGHASHSLLSHGSSGHSSLHSPLMSAPLSPAPGSLIDGRSGHGMPLMASPSPPSSSNNTPTPTVGLNRTNKNNVMQIRCKFGQLGANKGQFSSPHGFCLGMDEEIVIADTNNHRICVYDKTGEFKNSFGTPGKDEGQLWYPRKVSDATAT